MSVRVLIVGGGPAGAAVAIPLASAGAQVTVLEAANCVADKPGEHVQPRTAAVARELGVCFEGGGHRRVAGVSSAWERARAIEQDYVFEALGEGWIVDRARLEEDLAAIAVARGAQWHWDTKVNDVHIDRAGTEPRVTVLTERGPLQADVVVDATGRRARVARALGARVQAHRTLFATWAVLRAPLRGPVRIRAVEHGWWYLAAIDATRTSAVFFGDELIQHEAELHRRLPQELGSSPGQLDRPLRFLPAHCGALDNPCGRSWLAVGDAAATFDPLSAYGLHFALGTGIYAAKAILHGQRTGDWATPRDAYRMLVWQRYADQLTALEERYAAVRRFASAFWNDRSNVAALRGS